MSITKKIVTHIPSNLIAGAASYAKQHHDVKFIFLVAPFIIGIIASQKLVLGGEIYIGELMGMLYLAFQYKYIRFTHAEMRFLQFALLWAGAQLLSDLINESTLIDSFKGILAPIVFASTTLGLVAYFRMNTSQKCYLPINKLHLKLHRHIVNLALRFQPKVSVSQTVFIDTQMPSFLLGLTLGALLSVIFFPDSFAQDNPWKWGIGAAVVGLIAIYISFFQHAKSNILLSIALITFLVISLNFNGRSLAIFPLIALLLFILARSGKLIRFATVFGGGWGVARLVMILIPILILVNFLMSMVFTSDFLLSKLSDEAAETYRLQASGDFGMLLGGRSEILISSQAFFEKPFLGHGSWAQDKTGEYISQYISLIDNLGYERVGGDSTAMELGLIPTHSYLFGSLVWAGVLGGLFWIFILHMTISNFIRLMTQLPYYYYLGLLLLVWNVFFSPFGASARWSNAVFLSSYFAYIFHLDMVRKASK